MWSTKTKLIRWGAVYDILMTMGFATPWTARLKLGMLSEIHEHFGLSGVALPHPGPVEMLFINFSALIVMVWGGLRLFSPQVLYGAMDTAARFFVMLIMVYAISQGATPLIWIYLIGECLWFFLQSWSVFTVARQFRSV